MDTENKKKIYHLEDRAIQYIFHWFFFMIAGLRHIPEMLTKHGEKPLIYMPRKKFQGYHEETLSMLSDLVQWVDIEEDPYKNAEKYTIVKHHGEPLINKDAVHHDAYHFLRNIFLERMPPLEIKPEKKLYISRNDSSTSNVANQGKKVRNIVNEEELYEDLKALGFEIIHLSEYSLQEKICLFQSASVIVSPHGSGLSFSLFVDKNCKIVEILPPHIADHNHYKNLCRELILPYYRFTDVIVVGNAGLHQIWNMKVKKESFFDFLNMHILEKPVSSRHT